MDGPAYRAWVAFVDKYYPNGDQTTTFTVVGHLFAQTRVEVLKQCGDDLTRESTMRQAAKLHALQLRMLLAGITLSVARSDFAPL
jgi:branched-chain amino acid transport system substrate-binding protein